MIRLRRTSAGITIPEQGVFFHLITERCGRRQPHRARTSDEDAGQNTERSQREIPRRLRRRRKPSEQASLRTPAERASISDSFAPSSRRGASVTDWFIRERERRRRHLWGAGGKPHIADSLAQRARRSIDARAVLGSSRCALASTSHTATRARISIPRRHPTARVATVTLSIAAALLLAAPAAQASEPIASFKTTLVEPNAFGEAGELVAGTVSGAPGAQSFTIDTYSGSTDTIDVSAATVYSKPSSPGEEITLSDVESGDHVVVLGAISVSTVTATHILITPPAEPPPSLRELALTGIVQAQPSGESFTIETRSGSTDTVKVSPSTVYADARPAPGEESSPPTLSDVESGDYVGVSGTVSGATVTATSVAISTPQAGGHPDLLTSFALESPGEPEAAKNVVFDAPTGVFGNPRAAAECAAADFALDQCPPNSQVGLITLHADYKGKPNFLLGTAPSSPWSPGRRDGPLRLYRARLSTSRSRSRHRPHRPTTACASRSKTSPSSPRWRARTDLLGHSRRRRATTPNAFPKARPATRPAAPA